MHFHISEMFSCLRHIGEEGVNIFNSVYQLPWTLVHAHFEGFVTSEHADIPSSAKHIQTQTQLNLCHQRIVDLSDAVSRVHSSCLHC